MCGRWETLKYTRWHTHTQNHNGCCFEYCGLTSEASMTYASGTTANFHHLLTSCPVYCECQNNLQSFSHPKLKTGLSECLALSLYSFCLLLHLSLLNSPLLPLSYHLLNLFLPLSVSPHSSYCFSHTQLLASLYWHINSCGHLFIKAWFPCVVFWIWWHSKMCP